MSNALIIAVFCFALMVGFIVGRIFEGTRYRELGTMTVDPSNVEEGLFSIQFSDDPMNVADGSLVTFKVIRK